MLYKVAKEKRDIIQAHSTEILAMLSALLPVSVAKWPYGASEILEQVALASPALQQDERYIELKRRWDAR